MSRTPDTPPSPAVVYLGDATYRLPGVPLAVVLTFIEDCVLRAFLGREAMGLRQLITRSGVPHADRVLRRLFSKYPSLADAGRLAGKKGRGGYALLVVARPESCRQAPVTAVPRRGTMESWTPSESSKA